MSQVISLHKARQVAKVIKRRRGRPLFKPKPTGPGEFIMCDICRAWHRTDWLRPCVYPCGYRSPGRKEGA